MTQPPTKPFNYAVGMFGASIPINMLKTYAALFPELFRGDASRATVNAMPFFIDFKQPAETAPVPQGA